MNAPPALLDISFLVQHAVPFNEITISNRGFFIVDTEPWIKDDRIPVAIINNCNALRIFNGLELCTLIRDCAAEGKTVFLSFLPKSYVKDLFPSEPIMNPNESPHVVLAN